MREFTLPFKPEELLAEPADGRLWAQDLPAVDESSADELGAMLDKLIGRLLKTSGFDLAEDKSFSLVFALLQAWPRIDDGINFRVVDLLVDAARRMAAEVDRLKKATPAEQKDREAKKSLKETKEARTAAKVAVFFLHWAAERVLRQASSEAVTAGRRRGKGARRGQEKESPEEIEAAKEAQKALEQNRCAVLGELANLVGKGALPWLWMGDSAWQQVAQHVSDAGLLVLESAELLKHKETRQVALRCVSDPLKQEGHEHSNLLVGTVSKLMHSLRSVEGGASFIADALLTAHATPLPRLFLVELPQHCNPQELTSQGAFQRAMQDFLVLAAERLPHIVLANISVLLPLLDVDCYPLRSAIVQGIGQVLASEGKKLPAGARASIHRTAPVIEQEGSEEKGEGESAAVQPNEEIISASGGHFSIAEATKKDLMETLMTRTLDKSVWVRYRALQTLNGLASNRRIAALPHDLWVRALEIATRRMQDTASTTRKASMQLVRTLIELHPYGPALQGSGDERAKAEQLLKEVQSRYKALNDEEVAELQEQEKESAGNNEVTIKNEPVDDDDVAAQSQPTQRMRLKKKTVTDQTITNEIDKCLADADEGGARQEERKRQKEALKRMSDCYTQRVAFVELIDSAETRLRALLSSRTATDVTEAISVVVALRLRGLPAAAKAFDMVLGLVWSRTDSIRDAAVEAFYKMHLEDRDTKEAMRALLELYQEGCSGGSWTYTHMASVQELIQQAAEKELIDPAAAIPELVAGLEGSACPMALRALTALGAASTAKLASMLQRISELVGPGGANCGANVAERLERAKLLGLLLQRLNGCTKKTLAEEECRMMWKLSEYIIRVVLEGFACTSTPPQWFGAAQVAMDLTFDLAMSPSPGNVHPMQRCPDKIWEQIVTRMLWGTLGNVNVATPVTDSSALVPAAANAEGEGAADVNATDPEAGNQPVSSAKLGCAVYLSGHLALRMLVFLEGIQSSLKRKRLAEEDVRMAAAREKKEQKEQKEQKKKGGKKSKAAANEPEKEEEDEDAQASSLGMAGQEEREAELFAEIAEQGLLYSSRSLLSRVTPLIQACVFNANVFADPVLRRVGAISLCKYMTVSKRFCDEHMQLLFSVLFPKGAGATGALSLGDAAKDESSSIAAMGRTPFDDLTLRQSLLVAVGDLLFRHPNVVEPWTGRLYSTLGGSGPEGGEGAQHAEMRLTALLVLTHLVLNDMMKPRPVLLVRALWLTACTHEQTARIAKTLFQEISKRSTNVVYNLLPEIIARLPEHQRSAGQVKGGPAERAQWIMQFVEKEKHVEGLIEKLTARLEQAANVTSGNIKDAPEDMKQEEKEGAGDDQDEDKMQNRHASASVACLAHALGAMNYTDRCILRLHDAVVVRKAVHTALSYNKVVRECFQQIVEKTRKPKAGKGDAAAAAPAESAEPAAGGAENGSGGGGKGGMSSAAAAALDAIEQTIAGLASGKQEEGGAEGEPGTGPAVKLGKGAKRKVEVKNDPENPGFDDGEEGRGKKGAGRGRGRGQGKGRGRGAAPDKENLPVKSDNTEKEDQGAAAKKPRTAAAVPDQGAAAKKTASGMGGAELRAAMAAGKKPRRAAARAAAEDGA